MSMRRFDVALFDLDGTLVDTAPEIAAAVNAYCEELGLAPFALAEIKGWIGHGARHLLDRALASRGLGGISDAHMAAFDRHYGATCGTCSAPYPHVSATLAQLREAGVRLAVVTNKELRFARPVLDAHDLTRCFDLVVGGDTLPAKKPDPLALRHCLAHFGVPAQRAVYVGDSDIDIAAARGAGVAAWIVPYGYGNAAAIAAAGPDRQLATFADLAGAALRAA